MHYKSYIHYVALPPFYNVLSIQDINIVVFVIFAFSTSYLNVLEELKWLWYIIH